MFLTFLNLAVSKEQHTSIQMNLFFYFKKYVTTSLLHIIPNQAVYLFHCGTNPAWTPK